MAKSLRSKHKRKMRAAKRERYGAKELLRLKTMLDSATKKDVDMSEVYTIIKPKKMSERMAVRMSERKANSTRESRSTGNTKNEDVIPIEVGESSMDVDKKKHHYNPKTLKDQFGTYPTWMNQRLIAKHKGGTGNKKMKGKKKAFW